MTSAFVTPIVTRGSAAEPCAIRAAAVVNATGFFQDQCTGAGWRKTPPSEQVAAVRRNRMISEVLGPCAPNAQGTLKSNEH